MATLYSSIGILSQNTKPPSPPITQISTLLGSKPLLGLENWQPEAHSSRTNQVISAIPLLLTSPGIDAHIFKAVRKEKQRHLELFHSQQTHFDTRKYDGISSHMFNQD